MSQSAAVGTLADRDAADAASAGTARARAGLPWAVSGLLLAVAALLSGNPVLLLCALVASTSVLLARRTGWALALPAAVAALLVASTALGLVAAALDLALLARPWVLGAVYLALTGAATWVTARRPASLGPQRSSPRQVLVYLPAVAAAAVGVAQSLSTRVSAAWGLQGTDLMQHVIVLSDVQRAQGLDYAADSYPRGFHMLAALVAAPGAPVARADLLEYDLRLVAACSWLALALLITSATLLTRRLAGLGGVTPRVGAAAGVLVGTLLLLSNSVIEAFVFMGAVPSLLALVLLWVVPWLAARSDGSALLLLVAGAGATAVVAHLWQPLVLAPALAASLGAAAHLVRSRSSSGLRVARTLLLSLVAAVLAGAVMAPALLGLLSDGGTELAAIPGEIVEPPAAVFVLGMGYLLHSLRRLRCAWAWAMLGNVLGLLAATAVLLHGAGQGFDLSLYYPRKTLWFLALTLAPLAALAATRLAVAAAQAASRQLDRLGAAARVARICMAATVAAGFVGYVLPPLVAVPNSAVEVARAPWIAGEDSPGVERLRIGAASVDRFGGALVVPVAVGSSAVLDRYSGYVVSKVLSFQTGQAQTHGRAGMVCADIERVAGEKPAVVVTKLDPDQLLRIMRRDGCGHVRVVQIPGEIRDAHVLEFFTQQG